MRQLTDRDHLRTAAYSDTSRLRARRELYQNAEPSIEPVEWALGLVEDIPGQALDIGCGEGTGTRALRRRGIQVTSIDLSMAMVREASRHGAPGVCADVQDLPIDSGSTPLVLAAHMLYHVPQIEEAAFEIWRVLAPGGRLIATTNAQGMVVHDLLADAIDSRLGAGTYPRWVVHDRFCSENGEGLLRSCFDDVRAEHLDVKVVVQDPGIVVGYLESLEPSLPGSFPNDLWEPCLEEIRSRVVQATEAYGSFIFTKRMTAFIATK